MNTFTFNEENELQDQFFASHLCTICSAQPVLSVIYVISGKLNISDRQVRITLKTSLRNI